MYEDLLDFFDDPDAEQEEWQYAKSVQKGPGRLEMRELWSSTQMNAWFETEWAGVAQVFRLRRWVKDGEQERLECRPAYLGAREVDDSRDNGRDDDPEKLEPVKERDAYQLRILNVVEWRIEQGDERDEQQ